MSRTYSRRRGDRSLSREHVQTAQMRAELFLPEQRQSCLGIYERRISQPDADRVHTGSRTRNPHPAFVVPRLNLLAFSSFPVTTRAASAFASKFSHPLLHRTLEKIYVDNLLKAATQPAETTDRPLL